ncbi:MAG: hypothetical protein ACJ0BN_00390 [Limisphaerales bacterium]
MKKNNPGYVTRFGYPTSQPAAVKQGRLSGGFGASEDKIGPEYTFGIYMQKHLNAAHPDYQDCVGGQEFAYRFQIPIRRALFAFTEQQIEGFAKQGKDFKQIKAEKGHA